MVIEDTNLAGAVVFPGVYKRIDATFNLPVSIIRRYAEKPVVNSSGSSVIYIECAIYLLRQPNTMQRRCLYQRQFHCFISIIALIFGC